MYAVVIDWCRVWRNDEEIFDLYLSADSNKVLDGASAMTLCRIGFPLGAAVR